MVPLTEALIEAGEWRPMKKTSITFQTNFGGKTHRRAELEGRPHLVVDVGMIPNDGVMNGSGGAYFYPRAENSKSAADWNHQPIMFQHPQRNGEFVTGRTPDFINSRKLGVILNTANSDLLRSEAWFDEERTKTLTPDIYEKIINNQAMEGSTGLTFETDEIPGEKDGVKYVGTAFNYKPDHYAVLTTEKGAFPVAKGGGFFANTSGEIETAIQTSNREWTVADREKLPLSDFGEPKKKGFPIANEEDLENAASLLHHTDDPSSVKRRLMRIAKRKGLKMPESWGPGAQNQMNKANLEVESSPGKASTIEEVSSEGMGSHDDKRRGAHDALSKKYGERGSYWNGWVEDMFPEHLVYHHDGDLYSEGYSTDDKGVKLAGDRKKVERKMIYKTCNSEGGPVAAQPMDKKQFVNKMIANNQGWTESDRVDLEAMSENMLKLMPTKKPVANTSPPPPAVPPVVTNAGLEEYLKELEGKGLKQVANQVRRGIVADEAEKNRCVSVLMANEQNVFSEEFYRGKDVEELQGMVQMIPAPKTPEAIAAVNAANNGMFLPGRNPAARYDGMGNGYAPVIPMYGSVLQVNQDQVPKDAPEAPELDFKEHHKNRA